MKQGIERAQLIVLALIMFLSIQCREATVKTLESAPSHVDTYGEIAVIYYNKITEHYNDLTPAERVFAYYMYRASLPGGPIFVGQMHRTGADVMALFEDLYGNRDRVISQWTVFAESDRKQFIDDVKTFLIYLWSNHGQYFLREHTREKRTPKRIGLKLLTAENLVSAMQAIGHENAAEIVAPLQAHIFDSSIEPSRVVPNSIEESGVNFYSPDFTEKDFEKLSPKDQRHIHGYYSIKEEDGKRVPVVQLCKVGDKYSDELSVSVHWLEKAKAHAAAYPDQLDKYIVSSLGHLIDFLKGGDEEDFKKHSKEWLKTNSRIDYLYGFIETYDDPKSYRGSFQAEATVKNVDMTKINATLPALERALPLPDKYKRENLDDVSSLPNASINVKFFGTGHMGPLRTLAAYCLPNYEEIRSQNGSKQIIYAEHPGVGQLLNKELSRNLFHGKEKAAWLAKHDPDLELDSALRNALTILHETLGHGSGRVTEHIFVEGDPLTIDGKTYNLGDTTPVTSGNLPVFLAGYDHSLEELRAEIMALVSSIMSYDQLAAVGLFGDWSNKFDKKLMQELLMHGMTSMGISRLLGQADDATEISGDHARANTTIMFYIADKGGIELVEEKYMHEGKEYTVVDIKVVDLQKAIDAAIELAQLVQDIKSTGDGQKVRWLIDTYGKPLRHPHHMQAMKDNRAAIVGPIKVTALIFPRYKPVVDQSGNITDVQATWPEDIVDQCLHERKLAGSTEVV